MEAKPSKTVAHLFSRASCSASTILIAALAVLSSGSAVAQGAPKMVPVEGKDVTGQVFKRLGLPSQDYCWQQCVAEAKCTGTRWGVVSGSTAGQCQLLSGELTFHALANLKTEDGSRIVVKASRKE